ncbi:MAG TPA: malonate decarboxylase holo-ACP synthase [Chthoniobacterales bacterium]|jgi:phosphoribosyl-dephospho-CoA transferase|nr:malonate decarboxylase holo-ACP synthase [Chthoniobacterales bacterium]
MNFRSIRPHYLVKIDTAAISFGNNSSFSESVPASVRRELEETNFVVVRRGVITENWVPIGIRGPERFQRWAAWYPRYAIQEIVKPMDLLTRVNTGNDRNVSPARRTLQSLIKAWRWFTNPWGPAGSLGFEVATGKPTTTPQSDLDVVIYADHPLSRRDAQRLLASADDLEVTVDIRIETPMCGFSLTEYATSPTKTILLRTVAGPVLGADPWAKASAMPPR